MSKQPSLFDEPELLPALPGCIQGIVGKRETKNGRYAWDLSMPAHCGRCLLLKTRIKTHKTARIVSVKALAMRQHPRAGNHL